MMATEGRTVERPSRYERAAGVAGEIRRNRRVMIGLGIFVAMLLASLFGPALTPHDPLETNIVDRYAGPSAEYPLGTDHMGRDLLSRTLIGGRTSIFLGITATALSLVLGVPIGMTAGYKKGRVDEFLMRFMDIVMSIPTLLLGILILAVLPPNVWNVILAVGVVYAPRIARVVRSATLSVSTEDFVLSAKARGESDAYILAREIFPNILAPITVEGSIRVGFAILVGTSLSFLGLGAQPPYPDWGFMVATARGHIYETPWFLVWPALSLCLTIFSINLLGDGLRDVLDPKVTGEDR